MGVILMVNPPAPLVGLVPTAVMAATNAVDGDPWGLVTQLGIGGFLVGFAVWLQDKFSSASRKDNAVVKAEAKAAVDAAAIAAKAAVDTAATELHTERDRHDVTRAALIAALTKDKDKDS